MCDFSLTLNRYNYNWWISDIESSSENDGNKGDVSELENDNEDEDEADSENDLNNTIKITTGNNIASTSGVIPGDKVKAEHNAPVPIKQKKNPNTKNKCCLKNFFSTFSFCFKLKGRKKAQKEEKLCQHVV